MRRRALLSTVGTLLAGCTTADPPTGRSPGQSPANRDESAALTTARPTDASGPSLGQHGSAAPDGLFSNVDRVVSYRDVPDAPLALVPSAQSVSLPADLSATVRNRTTRRVGLNPFHWVLHKRVSGRWAHVVPAMMPLPLTHLRPGTSHVWRFSLSSSTDPTDLKLHGKYISEEGGGTIDGLGGGEYALTSVAAIGKTQYGLLARFTLDGPKIDIEPTGAVLRTTRENETVTVTVEGVSSADTTAREVLTLERGVSAPSQPPILPAERAVRDWRFRNSLPFFEEGVSTVHLRARKGSGVVPPFGIQGMQYRRYEGSTYRLTAKQIDSAPG